MTSHSEQITRTINLLALGYSLWIQLDDHDLRLVREHFRIIIATLYHAPGFRIRVFRQFDKPLTGAQAINIARRHLSGMLATFPQN